jgi:hypothetical protein
LQGAIASTDETQREMVGDRRYEELPLMTTAEEMLSAYPRIGPANAISLGGARYTVVTPDAERRALERGEFASLHLGSPGLPLGHGFTNENVRNRTAYYSTQMGGVTLIVMDTINPFGGFQGSLDEKQFAWLEHEIASSTKPVVLASHHPLHTIVNDHTPVAHERRICRDEIESMLLRYPQVILWLAGHRHRHHVEWVGNEVGVKGFWIVETASNIDWPQQSRTIEVVRANDGDIYIGMTIVDHAGALDYGKAETPVEIAALARVLSANLWQHRESLGAPGPENWAMGEPEEQNVVLRIRNR